MSQTLTLKHFDVSNPKRFTERIESELPGFLSHFNGKLNNAQLSAGMKFLFGEDSVISFLPIEDLDSKFLKPALEVFKNIFFSSLKSILETLEKAEESNNEVCFRLSEKLQACLELLGGYQDIILFVYNSTALRATDLSSLLETLPEVLYDAFSHCLNSQNNYGVCFESVSQLLSTFFKKNYDVLNLFFKLLDETISFDCSFEKDICLLISVLESLCSIGEVVINLDAKTLVGLWKELAKLLTKYSVSLKDRFNLTQPLTFLITSLENCIAAILCDQEENDEKSRNRNLKLGSFILKVIVKLCELYSGYLDTATSHLFKLLLLLNRCSRLSCASYNEELERFIVIGAGPLLTHLAKDRQFIEVFKKTLLDHEFDSPEVTLGFLYTLLRLFKFLINTTDSEVKDMWIELPLVESVIYTFSKCCKILNLRVQIDDSNTYTALVSVPVAFVASHFSPQRFIDLERFLFSQLLGSNVEIGILVSDILCLLGRLSSEDVCLKQTRYLLELVRTEGRKSFRPEVSLALVTGSRLYSLLSASGRDSLEREFAGCPSVWRHVEFSSPEKLSALLLDLSPNNVNTPHEYLSLVEGFYIKCCSSGSCETIINEDLILDFRKILIGLESCSSFGGDPPDWWHLTVYLLAKCIKSIAPFLNNYNLHEILEIFYKLLDFGKPSTCHFIATSLAGLLQVREYLSISNETLNIIFLLFKSCLSSNDVLIKQLVIDKLLSLDDFVKLEIIKGLDGDTKTQVFENSKQLGSHGKLCHGFDIVFPHKCKMFNYDSVSSPPPKKFKINAEHDLVSAQILKLQKDVDNLVSQVQQNPLSDEDRKIVHKVICKLENL